MTGVSLSGRASLKRHPFSSVLSFSHSRSCNAPISAVAAADVEPDDEVGVADDGRRGRERLVTEH